MFQVGVNSKFYDVKFKKKKKQLIKMNKCI